MSMRLNGNQTCGKDVQTVSMRLNDTMSLCQCCLTVAHVLHRLVGKQKVDMGIRMGQVIWTRSN